MTAFSFVCELSASQVIHRVQFNGHMKTAFINDNAAVSGDPCSCCFVVSMIMKPLEKVPVLGLSTYWFSSQRPCILHTLVVKLTFSYKETVWGLFCLFPGPERVWSQFIIPQDNKLVSETLICRVIDVLRISLQMSKKPTKLSLPHDLQNLNYKSTIHQKWSILMQFQRLDSLLI